MLLVAEHGQVSWLPLFGCVKLIVSTMGWSSIFSGVLAKYQPQTEEEQVESPPTEFSVAGAEDWRLSLNDISDLISVVGVQQVRNAYKHEMDMLLDCFESTFNRGRNASRAVKGKMQVVMSWVYQLDDVFIEQLEEKDPVALIILGYFCVLFSTIESYWFMEGWARHTMQEILHVSEACRKWLSWPTQYLGGERTLGGGILKP